MVTSSVWPPLERKHGHMCAEKHGLFSRATDPLYSKKLLLDMEVLGSLYACCHGFMDLLWAVDSFSCIL